MTSGVSQTESNAAQMNEAAAKFEQVNGSLRQMLSKLMSELSALEHTWRGDGATSFNNVKTEWSTAQGKIHQALEETAQAIRTAGQSYTTSDSEAAGRITRIGAGGGMSLPL